MALIHCSNDNFKELINDELVIVDFFATWCGPCRMLGAVLEEIKGNYKIVKVDVDECSEIAKEFGVSALRKTSILAVFPPSHTPAYIAEIPSTAYLLTSPVT